MTFNKDGTAYIAAELPANGGETMGTFGLNGTTSDDHEIKLTGGGTRSSLYRTATSYFLANKLFDFPCISASAPVSCGENIGGFIAGCHWFGMKTWTRSRASSAVHF
jgi:hypothetical protein